MPASAVKSSDFSARHFRCRYVVALSLIALLTLLSQWVIQSSIADQEHDSRIVNLAGRQRMLSQKIAKISFYLAGEESPSRRKEYLAKLEEALALWERSHAGLQHGDADLGLPGQNSTEVVTLFRSIESAHLAMVAAARHILSAPDDMAGLQQAAQRIRDAEPSFLAGMDEIVFRFDAEAKSRVKFVRHLETGLTVLILLVLALEAQFIFAPAVRRLRLDMRTLEVHDAEMETLFSASPTAMFLVDEAALTIIRCNRKAEQLLGCGPEYLQQRPFSDLLDCRHEVNRLFLDKIRTGDVLEDYEVILIDSKNAIVEALASSNLVSLGALRALVLGVTNIGELKRAQQTLEYYATFDEMTGLVNRRSGLMMLDKAVERAKRDATPLAVCYADLDGLKKANDNYGHKEGDWMIRTASTVLTDSVRKGDLAIRLGGDEFMLVLHGCPEPDARMLVGRIEKRLEEISATAGKPFVVAMSSGLALYDPSQHADVAALIAEADGKMYEAKRARKSAS